MPPQVPKSANGTGMKRPLLVVLVALYQLAKAVVFAYVFWKCWQAQGSDVPAFGDFPNPSFEAPFFFFFSLLAVFHLVLALGLWGVHNWARACSTLLLVSVLPVWFLERLVGHRSLMFPLEPSTMVSAFVLEAVAIAILYVTPEAREAFTSEA